MESTFEFLGFLAKALGAAIAVFLVIIVIGALVNVGIIALVWHHCVLPFFEWLEN